MNNAEYVKKLGLNYRDLTAKLEGHSEPKNLYTWSILNKITNKQIGSYTSLGKSDAITSIGEWLLQENEEDPKASLRNVLCIIAKEFINDPYISDDYLFADPQGYFVNLQNYTNTVNKLLGKDLCDTFHAPFLNEERKKIYIDYDGHYYVLASACGEKKEVHYDKINELVDKLVNNKYAEPKALLRNDLTLITMSFVYDAAHSVMIGRQSYIDKINKLVGRNICGIRHILFPDNVDETNIYVEWLGDTYLLGSVLGHKMDINHERINEFVDIYLEDTANG